MATGGEQYLKTPEHLLPWHVRHMLDVCAVLGASAVMLPWLSLLGMRFMLRSIMRHSTSSFGTAGKEPALKSSRVSIAWTFKQWLTALVAATVATSAVLAAADVHLQFTRKRDQGFDFHVFSAEA